MQSAHARMDACQLAARLCEPGIEGVETQQSALRFRRERPLMVFQRRRVLRPRQGRAQQECRSEREPKREAALPSTTHERGPYQRKGLVALRTNLNDFALFWPETAEIGNFVRS